MTPVTLRLRWRERQRTRAPAWSATRSAIGTAGEACPANEGGRACPGEARAEAKPKNRSGTESAARDEVTNGK